MLLFSETQKFRQWWIWVFLLFTCYAEGRISYRILISERPLMHYHHFVISTLICLFVIVLITAARLQTEITDKGISYKFFPFHLKKKTILWTDIDEAYVRKYKPISEYGGWGMRLGLFGSGKAYNVSGNMGLQLHLINGKRLLIGTRKPEEMRQALQQVNNSATQV